jgi:RNA polymerase sigma factor (sigma-70 family)
MKPTKALAAETTPLTKADLGAGDVMTPEQYAAAYAAGCTRTTRFLISRGSSPALSEEMAQAAWTKGWEHRSKLREPEKVVNWVNTIAFNLYRGEFRRREFAIVAPEVPIAPQTGPSTIDAQRILEQCSPSERALLQNYYSAGYTSKEIAQQMNCSPVTVRVRLMRLKRRIQMVMTAWPIGAAQTCP